jgi:hypothetical protein
VCSSDAQETRLTNWLGKLPGPSQSKTVRHRLNVTKRVLAAELGTVNETFSGTRAKFRDRQLLTVKEDGQGVVSLAAGGGAWSEPGGNDLRESRRRKTPHFGRPKNGLECGRLALAAGPTHFNRTERPVAC